MNGVWRGPVLVTGTDTGVGKTVVTAAIAAAAVAAWLRVAVVKLVQTGVADGEESDVDVVIRLGAPATARTLAHYPDPLAPLAAARAAGKPPLALADAVAAVAAAARSHDLVLVEGAGGLLVPLGAEPADSLAPPAHAWTAADLAVALAAPAVVVVRAGLGTLNHTALTLEALGHRGIPARVVIGAWPAEPDLVHTGNLQDLAGELAGALPDGAGSWPGEAFRTASPGWLTPGLYGRLDPHAWRA
jgi:dethiobiotin synthetase